MGVGGSEEIGDAGDNEEAAVEAVGRWVTRYGVVASVRLKEIDVSLELSK